jgi:16S rRNA processing protein RimM
VSGEVSVEVRTDLPELRFAPGAILATDPDRGALTVLRSRWHQGRMLVRFAEIDDRAAADAARGTMLTVDAATSPAPENPDDYWDHDLVGLSARTRDGEPIGVVDDVLHPPGAPLLVLRRPDGSEVFVPFVAAIVPTVDIAAGHVIIDPPDGLLEL